MRRDVTEENNKLQPFGVMNLSTIMEDVDSEFGSQNGLQGIDIKDPAHEKEGTRVNLEGDEHRQAFSSSRLF